MKLRCCGGKRNAKELADTVDFLKVIAEANRLKILCMLRTGEKCVCDIWKFLDLPQNLVSHHLKVLKDSKLIESRKDGLKVFYSLCQREVSKHNASLSHFLKSYER